MGGLGSMETEIYPSSGYQFPGRMAAVHQMPVSLRSGTSAVMVLGLGIRVSETCVGTVGSLPASSKSRWEEGASGPDSYGEMEKRPLSMGSD